MNRKESFRYAWRLFARRSSIITIVFLSLAFGWMIRSADIFKNMWLEMSRPVEIRYMASETVSGDSMPEANAAAGETASGANAASEYSMPGTEKIRTMDGCRDMTEYRESTGTLTFQGYSTQVIFVGMEREYLERKYGDRLSVSLESTMPYLILDVSVLESMKNEKKESMPVASPEEYVLQNFETDAGKKVRICGIADERKERGQDFPEEPFYVYTTLEGYEMLTSQDHIPGIGGSGDGMADIPGTGGSGNGMADIPGTGGSGNGMADIPGTGGSGNEEAKSSYLVELKNGFHLSRVIEFMENSGMSVIQSTDRDPFLQAEEWDRMGEKGRINLCLAVPVFICTMILCRYQKRALDVKYRDFWDYVRQYAPGIRIHRRIWHRHNLILGFFGIGGGVLFYFCLVLTNASKG